MEILREEVKEVKVKVMVSDETGQEERDISSKWLKRLGLRDVLNAIEEAVEAIE